jgi:hypothetical protein
MFAATRASASALVALRAPHAAALAAYAVDRDDDLLVFLADDLAPRADALLDAWLTAPDFTCCHVSVCLELSLDGQSFTERPFDHVWHQTGWFHLVAGLLEEGDGAVLSTFVWDESCLGAHREGDRVVLSDGRHELFARPFAWRPVSVPLGALADAVIAAGGELERLADAVLAACARRGVTEARATARLDGLGDLPRLSPDDVEGRLAVVVREASRFGRAERARLRAARAALP